ncbi:sugar phosphate isomerase/epimerase family protein [Streptomyces endophyticus]|uniref:Sugar phosphate isomerase/epimerase n=1 Tax=Streptomyces endophyticus TaxID=714166 RepID=A0ABU6F171_9ACTN|nr:sugar phosphate isomerase/epimerase family protein [Streptomyces endophyticus]MEB8337751.1 sugar phosphate isomerase/epimerase [Streptomyces endophyticus]
MCGSPQGFADGSPEDALRFAHARGLEGVLFATPRAISPDLDEATLRATAEQAAELGLYVETGIGSLGPARDFDAQLAELTAMIRAAQAVGCRQFFAYTRTVRMPGAATHGEATHGKATHNEQLDGIRQTMEALLPLLRGEGLRLNLKTHEDLSSYEVLRLVERCGPDVVGVSLDVANLVVRGEDPAEAVKRLAPHVHQTHLEDVALYFVEGGLRRKLRPCGAGVLDWRAILTTLLEESPAERLTLEQHRGRFDTDIFDPSWFEAEPHVRAAELATLVRGAWTCETRARRGDGPSLEDLAADPGAAARRAELDESAAFLRRTLSAITGGPRDSDDS